MDGNSNDVNVQPGHALAVHKGDYQKSPGKLRFQNLGKNSLSSIIGSYKSAVSKHARRLGFEFAWHTRFLDM
ncbi:MAG: hypothetical protein MI784_09515 [Cytophagales bacterium]|nr:hypothetical protein [Cytophagales bacterium]